MKIFWTKEALSHYLYWEKNDSKKISKIKNLILDIKSHPFSGIGKPEPLKNDLSGFWSRRINKEHRLVYKVQKNSIRIIACRYHY